ncbi:MAG: hypothetical protein M1816_003428 [Peltula sp. TS41687]|nr:MAG: hypothetical protein M1816_003428 [Peltula sp. TS41687]
MKRQAGIGLHVWGGKYPACSCEADLRSDPMQNIQEDRAEFHTPRFIQGGKSRMAQSYSKDEDHHKSQNRESRFFDVREVCNAVMSEILDEWKDGRSGMAWRFGGGRGGGRRGCGDGGGGGGGEMI